MTIIICFLLLALTFCSCEQNIPISDLTGFWKGDSGDGFCFNDNGTYIFYSIDEGQKWETKSDIFNTYRLDGNQLFCEWIERDNRLNNLTYTIRSFSKERMVLHINGSSQSDIEFTKTDDIASKIIPSVIFDTDLGNCTDDLFALHALFACQRNRLCKIAGIMQSRKQEESKSLLDRLMHYYEADDIPLGLVEGEEQYSDIVPYYQLVDSLKSDGTPLFEPTGISLSDRLPAWKLYRKLLSEAEDSSIVIICVGMYTNLGLLLESEADEYSPLSGRELVIRKVKSLDVMGCAFAPVPLRFTDDNGPKLLTVEYNISGDIPLAKKVIEEWPAIIHITPLEEGLSFPSVHDDILNAFSHQPMSPIYQVYSHYNEWTAGDVGQYLWDLLCTMHSLTPESDFSCSEEGFIQIADDGSSSFLPDTNGNCHIVRTDLSSVNVIFNAMKLFPNFEK